MTTQSKTAEEILLRHDIGIEPKSQMFEYVCDAMHEYKNQFCRVPMDESIQDEAIKNEELKLLFKYVPDEQSEGCIIDAFMQGAKFVRDNYLSDNRSIEWIEKLKKICEAEIPEFNIPELNDFLTSKPKAK